jgi:hypothetical protein
MIRTAPIPVARGLAWLWYVLAFKWVCRSQPATAVEHSSHELDRIHLCASEPISRTKTTLCGADYRQEIPDDSRVPWNNQDLCPDCLSIYYRRQGVDGRIVTQVR